MSIFIACVRADLPRATYTVGKVPCETAGPAMSPRRFKRPISVGELLVDGSEVRARTFELPPGKD